MPKSLIVKGPANYRVLTLAWLVEMNLLSNRRKDQVHVLDLMAVGLVDATRLPRLAPELAVRLQLLLDMPTEGC